MTIDLNAIEKRCDDATDGPWEYGTDGEIATLAEGHRHIIASTTYDEEWRMHKHHKWCKDGGSWSMDGEYIDCGHCWAEEDGQFIAHAREDIPALVAEVRKLREARNKALVKLHLANAEQNVVSQLECIKGALAALEDSVSAPTRKR